MLVCNLLPYSVLVAVVFLSGCVASPEPLTWDEIEVAVARRDLVAAAEFEPISAPISLEDAIARSIKYDLDYRIAMAETSLGVSQYELSNVAMLPQAVATAGYTTRNTVSASSSLNLQSGVSNFSASTSQDRQLKTSDIEIGWNILDFGLSYIRARQAGDKALIADELKRKVLHRLASDVRIVFARALTMQRLSKRMGRLVTRLRRALDNAKAASGSIDVSRMGALLRRRELIEMQQRALELKRDLITAKMDLAALMNVPPGEHYTLTEHDEPAVAAGDIPDVQVAVGIALRNRPEVRENLYKIRINNDEIRAAFLELLPGIKLQSSMNYDSNSFLLNNNWTGAGATVVTNLINVFAFPLKKNAIETEGEMLELRGRALALAIATQVYASYARFSEAVEEHKATSEYREVQRRVLRQMKEEAQANTVSEHALIREELNTVIAEARFDLSKAALDAAKASIATSIGLDNLNDISDGVLSPVAALSSKNVLQPKWSGNLTIVGNK